MKKGRTWEGKTSGGWEKRNTRGAEMGKVLTCLDSDRVSY